MTERPITSPKKEYMTNNYVITKYKKYIYIYTYVIIGFSLAITIGCSFFLKRIFCNRL